VCSYIKLVFIVRLIANTLLINAIVSHIRIVCSLLMFLEKSSQFYIEMFGFNKYTALQTFTYKGVSKLSGLSR
jgi:hypothetical protein